jgi:hypothetical protein
MGKAQKRGSFYNQICGMKGGMIEILFFICHTL